MLVRFDWPPEIPFCRADPIMTSAHERSASLSSTPSTASRLAALGSLMGRLSSAV